LALKCLGVGALLPWNLVELWTAAFTAVATGVALALTLQLLQADAAQLTLNSLLSILIEIITIIINS